MRLSISHETVYRYDNVVKRSTQYLRLTPHSSQRQRVLDWSLELPAFAMQSVDPYGNILHVMTLDYPHQEIRIRAHGTVETDEEGEGLFDRIPPLLFLRQTELTMPNQPLRDFADQHRRGRPSREQLDGLMHAIAEHLPYRPGQTEVYMPAAKVFDLGCGVCQDHTHVFLSCCRYLGIPARYVSGYIYSPDAPGAEVASHAWAEAWIDERWDSFDISNRCSANANHLKLAIGMDYLDACPVRGVRRGGGVEEMTATAWVRADEQ